MNCVHPAVNPAATIAAVTDACTKEDDNGSHRKRGHAHLATRPGPSSVEFAVKHMMMTTVRGRFKDVQATLTGDRDHRDQAGVEATIDVASIDTGVADRDAHLRSPDFFDAESSPQITFRSTRVENPPTKEGDRFRVIGDLTIRETPMEVALDCEYQGRGTDPWGKTRTGFSFRTEIDRREWGLRWNQALETGGVLVANKVKIEGELQFVRQDG